jgi:hypothetical protein
MLRPARAGDAITAQTTDAELGRPFRRAAVASPSVNPVGDVVNQRNAHASGECAPQQGQNQNPVGAKHNIEAVMVIGVTNHGSPRVAVQSFANKSYNLHLVPN